MGRPYAKLYRDIWADPDFTGLPVAVQYLYLFLLSQPNLNAAGVMGLTIRRWALVAGNVKPPDVEHGLTMLSDRKYVIADYDSEEVLIRTYIRNDGLWRIPNTLYAVLRDAEAVASPVLRLALATELASLPVDELTGKRADVMKAQVSRVTATLSATVRPRVSSTERQGLRQLFGQP